MFRMENELTDEFLMKSVKQGQVNHLGLLFERYHRVLFGFFYQMTSDPESSEDMVQNVFERILKYRKNFDPTLGTFKSWMFQLGRNVMADGYRKNKFHRQNQDVQEWTERLAGNDNIELDLESKQEYACLQVAIERLPQEHREVLVLAKLQQLKYQEIGQMLNCSEGNVKVKVYRALQELKKTFRETSKLESYGL